MSKLSRRNTRHDQYAYRRKLPFVGNDKGGDWWNVTPSGRYEADYQTGKAYAVAFWRICGGRPNVGSDLGGILMAMHAPTRRRSQRHNGLSGIEVGFIRTIGEIIAITVGVPVLIGLGPERIRKGHKLPAREAARRVRWSAKFTGLMLRVKHEQYRKDVAARGLH
jgi:hypothetical protein